MPSAHWHRIYAFMENTDMESRKSKGRDSLHKGYNEKNPQQPQGAFPPDGHNMADPPGKKPPGKAKAPVARKKQKRFLKDDNK